MRGIRNPVTSGQHALLAAIFEACGGLRACANKTGLPEQYFINWRGFVVGGVSPKYLMKIAEKLDIPPYGLNYGFAKTFWKEKCPTWPEAVRMYEQTEEQTENRISYTKILYILSLPEPA